MTAGDWALWVSTTATAIAAAAAAWQLFLLRRQQDELIDLEREGVAVTWHALTPPNDGREDVWIYTFEASNPGRFPISDVNVTIHFPVPVRRIHHSGVVEGPGHAIQVGTAVVLGGSTVKWKRTLQIDRPATPDMRMVRGDVSFVSGSGHRVLNSWPRPARDR